MGDKSTPFAVYDHKIVDKTAHSLHLNHDYAIVMGERISEVVWHSMFNNSNINTPNGDNVELS